MATLNGNKNVIAFLDMIGYSEGTSKLGDQNGYNVIVGGTFFTGYAAHPNVRVYLPRLNDYSTAAGRYQLLHRYWLAYRDLLKLSDFSPISQDRIAVQQLKETHALVAIAAGDFDAAVQQACHIWASFPGAGYKGQREQKLADLKNFYVSMGGLFEPQPDPQP